MACISKSYDQNGQVWEMEWMCGSDQKWCFWKEWMNHVTQQQSEWLKIEIVWNAEALESGGGGSWTSNVGKMVACSGLYLRKGGVPIHHHTPCHLLCASMISISIAPLILTIYNLKDISCTIQCAANPLLDLLGDLSGTYSWFWTSWTNWYPFSHHPCHEEVHPKLQEELQCLFGITQTIKSVKMVHDGFRQLGRNVLRWSIAASLKTLLTPMNLMILGLYFGILYCSNWWWEVHDIPEK